MNQDKPPPPSPPNKFRWPTRDTEPNEVPETPPEEFLKRIFLSYYIGTDLEAHLAWAKDQPTIWMNHPLTIRQASAGNQARWAPDQT